MWQNAPSGDEKTQYYALTDIYEVKYVYTNLEKMLTLKCRNRLDL